MRFNVNMSRRIEICRGIHASAQFVSHGVGKANFVCSESRYQYRSEFFLLSCTRWTRLEQTNLSTGGSRRREASGKPEDDSVTTPQSIHMTTAQPLMASNLSNPSIHLIYLLIAAIYNLSPESLSLAISSLSQRLFLLADLLVLPQSMETSKNKRSATRKFFVRL